MIEKSADLFKPQPYVDAICIPTNGHTTKTRGAVMGKGIALVAATKWPEIRTRLGKLLVEKYNHTHLLFDKHSKPYDLPYAILSFPTKDHWQEASRGTLIKRSAEELVRLTNLIEWDCVWLPRPGVGCGRLSWPFVRGIIEPILDDRFTVVHIDFEEYYASSKYKEPNP